MSPGVKRMLILAGIVTVAAVVSVAVRPPSAREQFFRVRAELQQARLAADSCSAVVRAEQDGFLTRVGRADSIRDRIGDLESLDRRGVPADSYALYLEFVDSFNAVIPGWDSIADTLRAHRRACAELVLRHNRLADSARSLAERAELLPAGGEPPGDR